MPQITDLSAPSATSDGLPCGPYRYAFLSLQETTGGAGDTIDVEVYLLHPSSGLWLPDDDFGTLTLTSAQELGREVYIGGASKFTAVKSNAVSGGDLSAHVTFYDSIAR